MPTLETPDGTPVDPNPPDPAAVNREFAAAMADDRPDPQAPPRRAAPNPPEGAPPRRPRGRPPKEARPRTAAPAAAAGPLTDDQRIAGVKGIAQVCAAIALMAGKVTGRDAYKADAVTIASAADDAAAAAVSCAAADPKFALALDKVCAAGPYGALITVAVGIGAQCTRNHRPALNIPGTVDPAKLLQAQDEAEAAAAAGGDHVPLAA
jgi:hypothetical protein